LTTKFAMLKACARLLPRAAAARRPAVASSSPLLARVISLSTKRPGGKKNASKELVRKLKQAKQPGEVSQLLDDHQGIINAFIVSAAVSQLRRLGKPHEALAVFERAKARGFEPDIITYSAVISACETCGRLSEACALLFEACSRGCFSNVHSVRGALDLHELSVPVARMAVRSALEERVGQKSDEGQFGGSWATSKKGDFVIITGRGKHSKDGDAVLRPAMLALLKDEYPNLGCLQDPTNPGVLVVDASSLRRARVT